MKTRTTTRPSMRGPQGVPRLVRQQASGSRYRRTLTYTVEWWRQVKRAQGWDK